MKCFISRHVTKNSNLQQPFTDALSSEIMVQISNVPLHYKEYLDVVSKVAMCIENFNAGVTAVRQVETHLATYLKDCLKFSVKILSECRTLSPTEKNEIFNLCHLSLRLLLHIVQKANEDSISKLILIFEELRLCIQQLMFDDDVPMDTKSVCGILYLSMHVMDRGSDSWIDMLNPASNNESLLSLLRAEAPQLCLYSAIATVVSVESLQTHIVNNEPAVLGLLHKILDIGDRCSSESTFILGVTRTVLQISKMLDAVTDTSTGLRMLECLLLFAWSHLEHYMDSVRHLTAQTLSIVVRYCAKLNREGDNTALNMLQTALNNLDTSRKSYYVSVTCLVNELGSSLVLETWPTLIQDVLQALSLQHIQASASTTLETLLQNHAKTCSTEDLNTVWVCSILSHVEHQTIDCAVLNMLENLLVMAIKLDHQLMEYIIPHIKQSCDQSKNKSYDLKSILMLLSVVRKSGTSAKLSDHQDDEQFKGIIGYDVLKQAAIDAVDETRILSLSLIVESPKSTEEFTSGDLSFVLYYLKYNINAQAPNFRQLTLSVMKKFIKRFEDSYKVIKRQKEPNVVGLKVEYYLNFLDNLRQQCFDSLLPGANYSRRYVALQVLAWCERLHMEGYHSVWKPEYVDKLLLHLEDSYENNKAFALEVLTKCPVEMLKNNTYSISLDIGDIFAQASALKPTECVSAAYKLDLLRQRLPENVLQNETCVVMEPVRYTLLVRLLNRLREELSVCQRSVVLAAVNAPMYGLIHCITHLLGSVDPEAISSDAQWSSLVKDLISTCMAVNAGVSSVVNNSSPEGHLPMDMSGVVLTDHGNSGGVVLDDGRQVTAQMVLLCAWRSVKEVSLLLGLISSRLSIEGEVSPTGTLTSDQLEHMGAHFTTLLAETKHRGAFEQAYVGFTKLLARLWRCRNSELHSLPQRWLTELTHTIASGDKNGSLCATRRSAGLPFMIQALVTTELQVQSNPKCFHSCMASLLSLARSSDCVESRSHALNILRALFRNSALDESVAPYVGDGLMIALGGFEGDSWAERNSSTLLFSALMVRVFGVLRAREVQTLSVRNRMTGRIFFLRYPRLYDYILEKLQEVSLNKDAQVLRPSLYPVLLLLARLYPSSLEGTVSNLKLVAFIPHVLSCAGSSVLKTRQLAATAMVPLISPEHYISHIRTMFTLLTHQSPRNYCHGILLQLVALLDAKPNNLEPLEILQGCVENTLWILEQAVVTTPCYLIIDEYVKVLNLFIWRFPSLLLQETINKIISYLDKLIFKSIKPEITSGRDTCLSNAIYLHFILLNDQTIQACELVQNGLKHSSYEVVISTLNYLLIQYENYNENKCMFLEHLTLMRNQKILDTFRNYQKEYIILLCEVLKNNYLECQQKSLTILTLECDTQKFIVEAKIGKVSEGNLIEKLFECLHNGHENLTHVYLESLLNYITSELGKSTLCVSVMLDVIRTIFEYSSADNNEYIRSAVVKFIENNIDRLLNMDTRGLSEEQKFELQATTWCTIITLIEDDDATVRRRVSDALTSQLGVTSRASPACGDLILTCIERGSNAAAMFLLIALVDFKSVVVTDDGNDECRVFDQNEKYNIFLEETVWTNNCADKIINARNNDTNLVDYVSSIIDQTVYKGTIEKLCNDNIVVFKKLMAGDCAYKNDQINPKIALFVKRLLKTNLAF